MAQFDVYQLADGQLVVDLQTDLIGIEASRIVAPLREAARFTALPDLTPEVAFEGAQWLVRVPEVQAVPQGALSGPLGSLAAHKEPLKRALDILINGI
ncbi:CcdB family protein [Shimia sp. R9_3]|uniref:CcdB family protein n=1 Tax=Shimia sp. R9_3 TaxID=2821113 RepID=UPI001ADAE534|nr:CcdB family protein [Shimia sp. R9_3]MBO9402648.1 CcdB family protein [Shimia sp. R9_3]